MEITYTSGDKSIEIKLTYIVKHRLRYYRARGKAWPKHTQCLMFVNGLLEGHGQVIKHENDVDNQKYAYKEATRKAISDFRAKDIRTELWKKVLAELETLA